jgi:hypothetical protein
MVGGDQPEVSRNGRVYVPDIEDDLLPQFKVGARCPKLKLDQQLA